MPHTEDHRAFLASVSDGLSGQEALQGSRVRLRMGVYANASKDLDMERRFDRAKMAANTLRNSYDQSVAHYDNQLRESELYAEQLLEDFRQALDERQFTVYYQPKFDIRPEIPVLTSAEALVRWNHPRLGFISPGVFIPLFEENGLIQQLDNYVWNRAAEQIRDWKERYGITIPVSVNVSRVDMYDPGLLSGFKDLIERNGIDSKDLYLEITESAYTQDSGQIIDTVNKLRELGFKVEMDDFGTGYSSLNMISTLPIDALKLDMKFIRSAFTGRKDTRMLEVILDIADYLSVPVVAEGVETEEQLLALRAMGCDIVQGYYFSKPVPPVEYEEFIKKRLSQGASDDLLSSAVKRRRERTNVSYMRIARALSSGYESIYYVDMANAHYVEFSARGNYEDLQIQESGVDFFADTSANISRVVYAEDQNRLLNIMKKEELKARLDQEESVSCTYRLVIKDRPVYYNMKVVYASGTDHQHIVIGVSNVEAVIEQGLACGAAGASDTRDALTGVKNRWAFEKAEDEISARMASGDAGEFALVICDINELKTVNDTRGHKAGDRYIQEASRIICNTFKHSPVYRIGGDEFAVLLRGQDYSVRTDLLAELEKNNSGPYPELDHILAYGMAEYAPGSDSSADDIFERADAQMYNYKRLNKR